MVKEVIFPLLTVKLAELTLDVKLSFSALAIVIVYSPAPRPDKVNTLTPASTVVFSITVLPSLVLTT